MKKRDYALLSLLAINLFVILFQLPHHSETLYTAKLTKITYEHDGCWYYFNNNRRELIADYYWLAYKGYMLYMREEQINATYTIKQIYNILSFPLYLSLIHI